MSEMQTSQTGSARRARRIPDCEWEQQRATMEELYAKDNLSRDEVIKALASKNNFVVTYVFSLILNLRTRLGSADSKC